MELAVLCDTCVGHQEAAPCSCLTHPGGGGDNESDDPSSLGTEGSDADAVGQKRENGTGVSELPRVWTQQQALRILGNGKRSGLFLPADRPRRGANSGLNGPSDEMVKNSVVCNPSGLAKSGPRSGPACDFPQLEPIPGVFCPTLAQKRQVSVISFPAPAFRPRCRSKANILVGSGKGRCSQDPD